MRKSRFSGEQIIGVLKEVESGLVVGEVCRKHGICDQMYYRLESSIRRVEVIEERRLRQLEEGNRRVKQKVAKQALDIQALRTVLTKNSHTGVLVKNFVSERMIPPFRIGIGKGVELVRGILDVSAT
jgi:putative transposase